jgi:HD-like signal output (HDOD) protein
MVGDLSTAKDLQKVLANAQLPALPQSAIRLLELSRNPDNGPCEYAAPIEADPGLTGQVLRFVNSSYFGFATEITSVKGAIALVGTRTIKNFALWSAVFSLMPNPKCGPFDLRLLWKDSLRRGLCARLLARLLGVKDVEEVFSAGLLQDMSVPILAREMPAVYTRLLEARAEGRVRLSDLESKCFGWTHAMASAEVARRWNLSESFAELLAAHTSLAPPTRGAADPRAALAVAAAALLPASLDAQWTELPQFAECYAQICSSGSIPMPELLAEIDTQFAELAEALNIGSACRPLSELHQEAMAGCS